MARIKPGDIFGRLTIIEDSKQRTNNGTIIWICKCECGNMTKANSAALNRGSVKSCGCYRKELNSNNLKDKRFGRLTVIENAGKTNDGHLLWKCKCDCGAYTIVRSSCLMQGTTKSCGCLNKEKIIERGLALRKELKGQKFGKLLVIEDLDEKAENREMLHLCQCDCGEIVKVPTNALTSENKTSCGCQRQSKGEYKIEQLLKNNHINYVTEYIDKNCKLSTGGYGRFDFFVNNKYYIEYDGNIHFSARGGTIFTEENFQVIQTRDKEKNDYCLKNKIPLIRIPYIHYKDLCIEDLLLNSSTFIVEEEKINVN